MCVEIKRESVDVILYAKCWTSMTTILSNGHAQGNFAADMPAVKIQFFRVEKRCTYVQTSMHIPIFKQYWNGGGGL